MHTPFMHTFFTHWECRAGSDAMADVTWDYDSPVKNYSIGNLNCRCVHRGENVVLVPVPSFWSLGLTISAAIASIGFLVLAFFLHGFLWQAVCVVLAIVFPMAAFVTGRVVDSYEASCGAYIVFSPDGRIALPRYRVEIRPDEHTEFRCHRYWLYDNHVEDIVLHHGDITYWVFSSGVSVLGESGTEMLRRKLEEYLDTKTSRNDGQKRDITDIDFEKPA